MIYLVTNQKKARKFLRDHTEFTNVDIPKYAKIDSFEWSDITGKPLSIDDVQSATFGLKVKASSKRSKSVKCTMFGRKAEAMLNNKGKITIKTKD